MRLRLRHLTATRNVAIATAFALAVCPLTAGAGDQVAVFTLIVNQVAKGDVLAVVRPDDILVRAEDLENAGVSALGGKREEIKKRAFISLASLAPEVKYELDPKTVALKIVVQAKRLGSESLDLRNVAPPAGLFYSYDTGLFLNYGFTTSNFNSINSFNEAGLSMFGNSLLDTTFSVSQTGTISRGTTSLTIDDRDDLRRLVLGDVPVYGGGPFGGVATAGGLSISKVLGIDPYFVQSAGQNIRTEVLSPSQVEVYVNGRRVFNQQLPPGTYTLQNIPYAAGAGNTEVVIRDAFGREQDFIQPFYYAPQLVQPGLHLYSLAFGPGRSNGTGSYSGPFVFSGSDTFGLTNWVSPGVSLEGSQTGLLDAGLTFNLGVPIGSITLAGAVSDSPMPKAGAAPTPTPVPTGSGSQPIVAPNSGLLSANGGGTATGFAGMVSYGYGKSFYSFGGSLAWMSQHYSNLSLAPTSDRAMLQVSGAGNAYLSSRVSVSTSFQYAKYRDAGTQESGRITTVYRLGEMSSVYCTVQASETSHASPSIGVNAGITFTLGSASLNLDYLGNLEGSGTGTMYSGQLSKSQPVGPGVGYLLSAQTGSGSQTESAQLQYRGDHTADRMEIDRSSSGVTTSLNVAGALVMIGGRLITSAPVNGSYGLVRVGGVPGVEVDLYHQSMGETDSHGDLLVPGLGAYTGNPLTIEDRDLPIDYRIDTDKEWVAPPYRGGAVVSFPVRPIRSFVGKLQVVLAGRALIPSFGQLTMTADGKSFISPIGRDGAFFLDSPPLGRYPARIDFDRGTCAFMINIPDLAQPFVRLGNLRCTME